MNNFSVYKMMAFQYKPVEKKMISYLVANGAPELVAKYKTMTDNKKVFLLDKFANDILHL